MKQIPGYPDYSIDEAGTTITKAGKTEPLKIGDNVIKGKVTGYKFVTLCSPAYHWKRIAIHRLVAITYIPNPSNLPEVNHKDRQRGNNQIENLEWCTHQQNIKHSYENGRKQPSGEDSKLFGRKASSETKQKQSEQKKGVNHPKFKGYYIVHHLKYPSARAAEHATKENQKTIHRKCMKGLPHSEYYFVPVPACSPHA